MPRGSQQTVDGRPCRNWAVHGSDRCASHLGRVGRPSELTPALADRLVQLLRVGSYVEVAARAAGISRRTFNAWLLRGRSTAARDAPCRELRERVDGAAVEAPTAQTARPYRVG